MGLQDVSDSTPINDTRLNRFLTLAAMKLPHISSGCVRFPRGLNFCIKCSVLTHLAEASAMQYVGQHTSIPVPKVFCSFQHKGRTYIVMEKLAGKMVAQSFSSMTELGKDALFAQLRDMMAELRNLSCPAHVSHGMVANVDGGPLWDCRLEGGGSERFGPFTDVQAFHRHLRNDFTKHPDNLPGLNELIDLQGRDFDVCFTHGDLSAFNILVRGDKVVGIVDWETAGWLPTYWEYTSTYDTNPWAMFWRDEIHRFLQCQPEDLVMENIRRATRN